MFRPSFTVLSLAAAVTAGAVASGSMILGASYAAFGGTTNNGPNTFSVGSVTMTNDSVGQAMFTTAGASGSQVSTVGLKPGQVVQNCIRVNYTGSLPATVHLYADAAPTDNHPSGTGLAGYLHVTVAESNPGAFGCAGFAGGTGGTGGTVTTIYDSTHPGVQSDLLSAFPTSYAAGTPSALASWTTGDWRAYRITLTVDSAIPDTSQGADCSVVFDWQAQNS